MNKDEERIVDALSSFFFTMAPKSTIKRSTVASKSTNILAKGGKVEKKSKKVETSSESESSDEEPQPPKKKSSKKSKKVPVVSSSSSSSESESESEPEPPKSKKGKGKKVEKVVPPSDDESEDDCEIPLHAIPKRVAVAGTPVDNSVGLGEGLLAIAEQMAIANQNNARMMELIVALMTKLEQREEKEEVVKHLRVESGEELVEAFGPLTGPENFVKDVEHEEEEVGEQA